ncbi:MAG: cation transporter [Bacteroidia bacterium]
MKHSYSISGMTCSGCQAKVQHLLSKVEGVKNVRVDLEKNEVEVEMGTHISTDYLKAALKEYPKYQLSEKKIPSVLISETTDTRTWFEIYQPILLIFFYISAISIIASISANSFNWMRAMRIFMSGSFLVFSFFKMLDLKGFADSYAMYDIFAKKWKSWGFVYAFLEAGLGIAYAANLSPIILNSIMIIIMTISSIGVIKSVLSKTTIRCACLGAVFNLPMSTVTIIEDVLMIFMGIITLLFLHG